MLNNKDNRMQIVVGKKCRIAFAKRGCNVEIRVQYRCLTEILKYVTLCKLVGNEINFKEHDTISRN